MENDLLKRITLNPNVCFGNHFVIPSRYFLCSFFVAFLIEMIRVISSFSVKPTVTIRSLKTQIVTDRNSL